MFLPFALAPILFSGRFQAQTQSQAVIRRNVPDAGEHSGPLDLRPITHPVAQGHRFVPGKPTTINTWAPISPYGISVDPVKNIWNSGHVSGILPLASGYLVSADTGGAYLITGTGSSFCVSYAWDNPDTHSMCFGIHGNSQVFVGGGELHVTDWKSIVPYLSWFKVDMSTAGNYGYINSVAADPYLGTVVIATSNEGILWSFIQDDPTLYVWHQASGTPPNCYTVSIAEPGTIVVGSVRSGPSDPNAPLCYGAFDLYDGTYDLAAAHIAPSVDPFNTMFCTSVCTDPLNSANTYAVASDMKHSGRNGVGFVSKILSSTNGGYNWTEDGYFIPGDPGGTGDIRIEGGDQGYTYNNCIACGGAGSLLIGWSNLSFWSVDNGFTWNLVDGSWFFDPMRSVWFTSQDDWNVHPDYHTVGFQSPGSTHLLLGNDGGFSQASAGYNSTANTFLPTMQFYGNCFGVSPAVDGLCAGGNQDNGIPYTIAGLSMPYQETELGFDGSECRFIKPGQMIFNHDGNSSYAVWTGSSLGFTGFIPVGIPKPGQDGSRTIPAKYFEPVPQPSLTRKSLNIYGMLAEGLDIYELLGNKYGSFLEYAYLGTLPGDPTAIHVSAMGMMNLGAIGIFLATSDGNLYNMDPISGVSLQLAVNPPTDFYGNPIPGEIDRIAFNQNSNQGYAVYNGNNVGGFVLKSDSTLLSWSNYGTNVPTQDGNFSGLAVGESPRSLNPAVVYLSSDANVYQSTDGANTWTLDTAGLPTRTHIGQLVFMTQSDGTHWLYAPSYGSAVWRMQVP